MKTRRVCVCAPGSYYRGDDTNYSPRRHVRSGDTNDFPIMTTATAGATWFAFFFFFLSFYHCFRWWNEDWCGERNDENSNLSVARINEVPMYIPTVISHSGGILSALATDPKLIKKIRESCCWCWLFFLSFFFSLLLSWPPHQLVLLFGKMFNIGKV